MVSTEKTKNCSDQNSLYSVECLSKKNYQRFCTTFKDGVKKGHGSGNGSRLFVEVKKLESQKEIRPTIDLKFSPNQQMIIKTMNQIHSFS